MFSVICKYLTVLTMLRLKISHVEFKQYRGTVFALLREYIANKHACYNYLRAGGDVP